MNERTSRKTKDWYAQLAKPTWSPPSYLFGPVWTVLYIIIFFTFGRVFLSVYHGVLPFVVLIPFVLNLFFNFLFTPLQFGLKSNILAALDILLVLVTLVLALAVIFPIMPSVALWNIPYLLWVSFATVLQLTITFLNRKK